MDYRRFLDIVFCVDSTELGDFAAYLRVNDVEFDYCSLSHLQQHFLRWRRSKRRGKFRRVLDRRRRTRFSPGRYHASSPAGVFLNRNFVKGWRGVNPVNP